MCCLTPMPLDKREQAVLQANDGLDNNPNVIETDELSVQDRLLLVTTMTMMLSTEIHNPAIPSRQKVWTREKFQSVGVLDCGVQPSVMKKIYDRVREFPLATHPLTNQTVNERTAGK